MTTKGYLSQIHKYDVMIINKKLEIEEIESRACSITVATDKENVKSSGNQDKIGTFAVMVADLSKECDIIKAKRKVIVHQIETLKNEKEYDVLCRTFILNQSLKEIADEMDKSIETVKKLKKSGLKNFEMMYGYRYLPHEGRYNIP